jgi:hypothetical protein
MATNRHLVRKVLNGTIDAYEDAGMPNPGPFAVAGRHLSDERLLVLGLNALARAHELDYFVDGHRGASIVAAHLLCVDNGLDARASSRIAELIGLNWASTALCEAFPEADVVRIYSSALLPLNLQHLPSKLQ